MISQNEIFLTLLNSGKPNGVLFGKDLPLLWELSGDILKTPDHRLRKKAEQLVDERKKYYKPIF